MQIDNTHPQGQGGGANSQSSLELFLFGNISPDWMPFCISITRSGISKGREIPELKREIEGLDGSASFESCKNWKTF